jgi:hypothetical protein
VRAQETRQSNKLGLVESLSTAQIGQAATNSHNKLVVSTKSHAVQQRALRRGRHAGTQIVLVRAGKMGDVLLHAGLVRGIAELDQVAVGTGNGNAHMFVGAESTSVDRLDDPVEQENDGLNIDVDIGDPDLLRLRRGLEVSAEGLRHDDECGLRRKTDDISVSVDDVDHVAEIQLLASGSRPVADVAAELVERGDGVGHLDAAGLSGSEADRLVGSRVHNRGGMESKNFGRGDVGGNGFSVCWNV